MYFVACGGKGNPPQKSEKAAEPHQSKPPKSTEKQSTQTMF